MEVCTGVGVQVGGFLSTLLLQNKTKVIIPLTTGAIQPELKQLNNLIVSLVSFNIVRGM